MDARQQFQSSLSKILRLVNSLPLGNFLEDLYYTDHRKRKTNYSEEPGLLINFLRYYAYLGYNDSDKIKTNQDSYMRDEDGNIASLAPASENSVYIRQGSKETIVGMFPDYYNAEENEDYKHINRPLSPKTLDQIFKEYGTNKIVMKITQGVYVDLYKNILFINYENEYLSKAEVSIDFALLFFKPFLDLDTQVKEEILTTNKYLDLAIIELEKKRFYGALNYLMETIHKSKIQNEENLIERYKTEAESYLKLYENILIRIKRSNNTLFELQNNPKEEVNKNTLRLFDNAFKNNLLFKVDFSHHKDQIKIYFKPLPIIYLDNDRLERAIPNISKNKVHEEYLKKVVEGTHSFYIAPTIAVLNLENRDGILQYKFFTTMPLGDWTGSDSYNRGNQHALWDGTGCLGTFGPPIKQACVEMNLAKLFALILQFYQSMTIGDLGDRMAKSLVIVNNETKLVEYDPYTDREYKEPIPIDQVDVIYGYNPR